jgi:hypothetical protein
MSDKIEEIVPSDKTYNHYLGQYELYKYAHSGYAHYLSYELFHKEKDLTAALQLLRELDVDLHRVYGLSLQKDGDFHKRIKEILKEHP